MSQPKRHRNSDFSIDRILAPESPSHKFKYNHVDEKYNNLEEKCDNFEKKYNSLEEKSNNFEEKCDNFKEKYTFDNVEEKKVEQFCWVNQAELPWLRCTRYKPPKLPRKNVKIAKRKLGSHPRIPFTKFQLEVLEQKYKEGAYLTRKDVVHLAGILQLPQSRVKIWFQNRRARERKEARCESTNTDS